MERLLCNCHYVGLSRINVLSKILSEYFWIQVDKPTTVRHEEFFREVGWVDESRQRLAFIWSKGRDIHEPCDVRIIISSICDYCSTIRMAYKSYWSANMRNSTFYSFDIICQGMKRKLYSDNFVSCFFQNRNLFVPSRSISPSTVD